MKTYSIVYISIHYYKFYSAEFDSKYRSIQKPLPSNEKQTNLYLFYYLESLVEVRVGVPLFPSSPSYFDSLRIESLEYRSIRDVNLHNLLGKVVIIYFCLLILK